MLYDPSAGAVPPARAIAGGRHTAGRCWRPQSCL